MGWGGLDVDTEEAFLEHAPGVAYIVMIKGVWDGVSWMLKLKGLSLNMLLQGGLANGGCLGRPFSNGARDAVSWMLRGWDIP